MLPQPWVILLGIPCNLHGNGASGLLSSQEVARAKLRACGLLTEREDAMQGVFDCSQEAADCMGRMPAVTRELMSKAETTAWTKPGGWPAQVRIDIKVTARCCPGPAALEVNSGAHTDDASSRTGGPRVFVSYAHDDEQHVDCVRAFSEFLTVCGVDVHIDRWYQDRRRDWYQWAVGEIKRADFVVVIASTACRLAGDGEMGNAAHRGMQSELSLLRELLHSDRDRWLARLLPVVLPNGSVHDIPLFLQPQVADHYLVREFTVAGADDLLRAIFRWPLYRRPERGAEPIVLSTWAGAAGGHPVPAQAGPTAD